jgi:hypothetical protein
MEAVVVEKEAVEIRTSGVGWEREEKEKKKTIPFV